MKISILRFIAFIIPLFLQANTYFVAPNGDDTNSGTEAQPWKTLQKAANTLIAGDTVFVKAGNYNERVIVQNSGTAGHPVVFSKYQDDTVIIDGTGISWGANWNGLFDISDKTHIQITGLQVMHSDYAGFWIENSGYISIENCYTYDSFSSGIGVWNSNNIRIDNNEIELACNDGEQECISIAKSYNCDVFENHIHNNGQGTNGGEGIDVKQGSHDINVYKNLVHHLNNRLGIYADAWDLHTYNINIYQNVIHHCSETGLAVASENGGLIENVKIFNNIIYLNKYGGIELGSWSDAGFNGEKPIENIQIINNTCYKNGAYDNGWGYGIEIDNPDANNIIIRNNICSENNAQIAIQQIEGEGIVDHNLFFGNNSASGCVYGTESIIGNPLFTNADVFDFHLSVNSPAIDNGSAADAPEIDFEGNNRPFGNGFDIGAYENILPLNIPDNTTNGHLLSIYPNPCSEKLTLNIPGEEPQKYYLQLFDDRGRHLKDIPYENTNSKTIVLYTDRLNSGVYILHIRTANQVIKRLKLMVK